MDTVQVGSTQAKKVGDVDGCGIFLIPAGYSQLLSVRTTRKEGLLRERRSMYDSDEVLRVVMRDTVRGPISQECPPIQEDVNEGLVTSLPPMTKRWGSTSADTIRSNV